MTDYADRARSWSQLTDYESCPQKFYLKRVAKVWARPAAWLAMGVGVHAGAEAHGKREAVGIDGMLSRAQEVYRATINDDLEKTPNPEYWFASGRYRGPEDIFRRYGLLRKHLENYLTAVDITAPWAPGGAGGPPAIEWPFEITLDGVKVIGFADRIDVVDGDIRVVDVKSGSKVPKDPGQLKLYALAAEKSGGTLGAPVKHGAYLMTKDAKVRRHDLVTIPEDSLTARFRALDDGVKAGNWDPTPGPDCSRCEVLTSCKVGQDHVRKG